MNRLSRARAARIAGLAASFVVAVRLIESLRPALLTDPEPAWAVERLLLGLAVVFASAAAGALAAAFLYAASGVRGFRTEIEPLALAPGPLGVVLVAALAFGVVVRFVWLEQVPWPLWVDDLSLIGPTRALSGGWRDFADALRPAPYGVPHPFGTVGVAYLEVWRLCLSALGSTVLGVRFPSFAAGVLSLATAAALGRALLPGGGGTLAALVLAGMRWSLILSRWGWVAIVLAPILDVAALALIAARRRGVPALAAVAGLVAGLGAHVYLAAWIAGVALVLYAAWPGSGLPPPLRTGLAAAFVAGFALAAAPLFLARPPGSVAYMARASDANALREIQRQKSVLPVFATAAGALTAPWFDPDPQPRQDIPGRSRLGWVLGIPAAAIGARALLAARDELSGFLLAHGTAASLAAVAAGRATNPNGFRYGYLTTVAAVAVAGGILWLLRLAPPGRRRLGAVLATGALFVAAASAARDTLLVWGESRSTFDGFHGEDTLIGRAAARWSRFGRVAVDSRLGFDPATHSPIAIEAVYRNRLEPDARRRDRIFGVPSREVRVFRVALPGEAEGAGERVVERVRDGWGRDRAVVLGRREADR